MPVGGFVLSLDLELAWGLRQSRGNAAFPGIERVREVVDALLHIFTRYEISATWAVVGHLLIRENDCSGGCYRYDLAAPQPEPGESEWYAGVPPVSDPSASQYYAPDIADAIVGCKVHQELASHTFSHVDIGDPRCREEVAEAEFARCSALAAGFGRTLRSVVFPHNRIGHLATLRRLGYTNYRGLNSEWYWFGRLQHSPKAVRLAITPLRFLDERLAIRPPLPPVRRVDGLWEIPHSMFFPPFSGISKYVTAENRTRRALRGLRAAARRGRVFSMWTHPHNLLPEPEQLLPCFEAVCAEVSRLRQAGELDVLTMEQLADRLARGDCLHWTK